MGGALVIFEEVIGMEPPNYMGDNFETATAMLKVSQYNVACCYSQLQSLESSIDALNESLRAGFNDYKKIRSDPSLSFIQSSDKFKALLDRYDEPIFNENAIKMFKGLFGGK